jgi:hypothetical protein
MRLAFLIMMSEAPNRAASYGQKLVTGMTG